MARHFMAVCVVCLLCAEHLPCKQHFDESLEDPNQFLRNNDFSTIQGYIDKVKAPNSELLDEHMQRLPATINKRRGRTKTLNVNNKNEDLPAASVTFNDPPNSNHYVQRTKRHAVETENETSKETHNFVKRIFEKFGNGDALTMNITGFEMLLKNLHMDKLVDVVNNQDEHHRIEDNSTVIFFFFCFSM